MAARVAALVRDPIELLPCERLAPRIDGRGRRLAVLGPCFTVKMWLKGSGLSMASAFGAHGAEFNY